MKLDLKKLEDKLDSALEAETNESLTEWITSNKRKAETTNPSKYKKHWWDRLRWWWFWRGIKLPMVRKAEATVHSLKLIKVEPMGRPSGLIFYLDFESTNFVYFDKGIDKTAKDIVRPL